MSKKNTKTPKTNASKFLIWNDSDSEFEEFADSKVEAEDGVEDIVQTYLDEADDDTEVTMCIYKLVKEVTAKKTINKTTINVR